MQIIKTNIYDKDAIKLKDQEEKIIMFYAPSTDFYLVRQNYKDNNSFVIDKDNILYPYLKFLPMENNTFIWESEDYGEYEGNNKMIIKKEEEKYTIEFIQNKMTFNKDICTICFCLSGSKDQRVVEIFTSMFHEINSSLDSKTRTKQSFPVL